LTFTLVAFASCQKEEAVTSDYNYTTVEVSTVIPDCQGEALTNVFCPSIYDPVCGCNNITYSNSCIARAAGITSWAQGICP